MRPDVAGWASPALAVVDRAWLGWPACSAAPSSRRAPTGLAAATARRRRSPRTAADHGRPRRDRRRRRPALRSARLGRADEPRLSATYEVRAAITVGTGALEVATMLPVTKRLGRGIDRLELNTIAARLGGMQVTDARSTTSRSSARIDDQTLLVPLGGVLPAGATATVRIAYRATLRRGSTGSDWMFTRSGGTSRCIAGSRGSAARCPSTARTTATRSSRRRAPRSASRS